MRLSFRAFWLPKRGSSLEEYEDAYSPKELPQEECSIFKCAVADGATETSFSGLWAQILTDGYVAGITSLEQLQKDWLEQVSNKPLPWYAEQKLESGAFAAIVSLTLEEKDGSISWRAKALGDSCLFRIAQNKITSSFPLNEWHEFNNSPLLLSSKAGANVSVLDKVIETTGTAAGGDIFYLTSDAIACWILRRQTEMQDAVSLLEAINTQEELAELVDKERSRKDDSGRVWMTNDDVTFMRLSLT